LAEITIYTNSFPYGTSETFLENEMPHLARNFSTVFIMPFRKEEGLRELPGNVKILPAIQTAEWSKLSLYFTGLCGIGRLLSDRELGSRTGRSTFPRSLKYLGYGLKTRKHILRNIRYSSDIHYTYWLGYSTFALADLRRRGRIDLLVSRAHGYDLYEERAEKGLLFLRTFSLKYLDRLYCISQHGADYILKKYPRWLNKISLARLGTPEPGSSNPVNQANSLVLVSCSSVDQNKRTDLILRALMVISSAYPGADLTWHHFGTGKSLKELEETAATGFRGTRVSCVFHGQVLNSDLFNFYRTSATDLFINVSRSEGIPVSVMEAQSFSIPVAATESGGITELVNDENGLIMPVSLTHTDLAGFLAGILEKKAEWQLKRTHSRESWESLSNQELNYSEFASGLAGMTMAGNENN
jgi:glycosyltransferase involved in cell wall biosynthesis